MTTFQTDLRAFHGDPAVKKLYLDRVRQHQRADELIHGIYWQNGRGCAVGCTIHSANHAAYETELGLPRILARLEDRLFEGMANGKASTWPSAFLDAIRVGADLSLVWPRFAIWLLVEKRTGVIRYAKTDAQRAAIQRVAALYGKVVKGDLVAVSDWRAAAAAADAYAAAYAAAADAAAYAAAAAAAYADAAANATDAAAAYAAAYAADAAAYAAAANATGRQRSYERMARKLLTLLKTAPVPRKARVLA
jgi:hypothetical protein